MCSGHIPHHRCCSVYVISRVQIAFHITLLNSTPQSTFSHHTSFHHITPKDFTSHHLSCHTIPHHTTIAQLHITLLHTTVPRHISQTVNVATHPISDYHILHLRRYTAVCLGTTISHYHISKHMFHIAQPQSTSHTIPHPQLFHTTPTFNITAYFTPPHIPHRITPPHLTTHCIISHSTLHMPHSSPPHYASHFALCNIPHTRTPHSTPRHITHFAFQSHHV